MVQKHQKGEALWSGWTSQVLVKIKDCTFLLLTEGGPEVHMRFSIFVYKLLVLVTILWLIYTYVFKHSVVFRKRHLNVMNIHTFPPGEGTYSNIQSCCYKG